MEAQNKRYRQVAIVVSSLDRDTADNVLAQMSDEEASSVRRAILSLDTITDEEQSQALAEFMRRGGKSVEVSSSEQVTKRGAIDSGVELDASLVAKLQTATPAVAAPTFACLNGIDGAWLAPRICQEHPQTIAVVVSHLSEVEAARLLGALPPAQQTDVIRRLADLDEMDAESLREIETFLTSWVTEHWRDRQRRTVGVTNVAAILRAADPLTRNRLVKQLRLSDQQLAEQIKANAGTAVANSQPQVNILMPVAHPTESASPELVSRSSSLPASSASSQPYTNPALTTSASITQSDFSRQAESPIGHAPAPQAFEELASWTEQSLRTLLRECEPELILLALTGASERVVRCVMDMFPARQAATLRHALKHPGPTRLSDVAEAQQEIVQLAIQLEREGRLPARNRRLSMAA